MKHVEMLIVIAFFALFLALASAGMWELSQGVFQ